MAIKRISLRTLITALLLAVVVISAAHTMLAQYQFYRAALDYRSASLARVVEVATQEVLRQARMHAMTLGSTLQGHLSLDNNSRLTEQLREPFTKGYVETRQLDLVMLRVYDAELHLRASSGQPADTPLPAALMRAANARTGIDRLKALGGLWTSRDGLRYSLLLPIGGLRVTGYLEVVFNPLFNLHGVGSMIQMPLGIRTPDGAMLSRPATINSDNPRYAPVAYPLRDVNGRVVLELIAYEDIDSLAADLQQTQRVVTASFLVATVLLLLLALWLLQRYLFQPVHRMIDEMEHALHDEERALNIHRGIKEVHIVAAAFNAMAARVRNIIDDLHRLSTLDALTGIANRRSFNQMLEREWQHAMRTGKVISLLIIDIDYFKQYNDRYGHQAGDECLQQVANALSLAVHRPGDLVARYGGEEFVVLLPETDAAGAYTVAQKLQQMVQKMELPHEATDNGIVTMSIGACSLTPATGQLSEWLIAGADLALYRAKANGRDRIEVAEDRDWATLAIPKPE